MVKTHLPTRSLRPYSRTRSTRAWIRQGHQWIIDPWTPGESMAKYDDMNFSAVDFLRSSVASSSTPNAENGRKTPRDQERRVIVIVGVRMLRYDFFLFFYYSSFRVRRQQGWGRVSYLREEWTDEKRRSHVIE